MYYFTAPFSVPQIPPALACLGEFELSPCFAEDGCLLQLPAGEILPKHTFRGRAPPKSANRVSHQNWLDVKRKIMALDLFFHEIISWL